MGLILNIETATTNCSVSLAKDGELISLKEHNTPNYSHSEKLHVFIQDVVKQASLQLSDLNAIAVSKGPGSYTGLRIGVSAAKGLCFSLGIPLISVPTLESLAHQLKIKQGFIIPVLDARRMEVYSAVFDNYYEEIRSRTLVVQSGSFISRICKPWKSTPGRYRCRKMSERTEAPQFQFSSYGNTVSERNGCRFP